MTQERPLKGVHYSTIMTMPIGTECYYGDGSGTYFDILTSIDVAAHEIGHAVCSYTANLAYQKNLSTK
jgi:Zn-dependent metalloprotease